MIILPEEKKKGQIYFLSDDSCSGKLEQTYIDTRLKEGRIYSNDILAKLPQVCKDHPLHKEWKIRGASTKLLIKYFSPYKELEILDLGCGNGWFANQLSTKTENFVTAMDINKLELEQGAGVFSGNRRLQFAYGDIFENILPPRSLDAVIISSAIQYFENPVLLINRLLGLLNITGEIHIIDSNFYKLSELAEAKHRTELYLRKIGSPEMIQFYHHHTWEELKTIKHTVITKSIFSKLFSKIFNISYSPFPWIRIKVKDNF
jgi:ubiquinone/menaquinone biosynthesis C-methylase UbiE